MKQKTIKKSIEFSGLGIHTGAISKIKLKPLPENSGIIFKRYKKIKLNITSISNTNRAITIGKKNNSIITIEHLIASLYMMGISNILIETVGPEIPALDGSAKKFLKLIEHAGIVEQPAPQNEIIIKKPIYVLKKDKYIAVLPSKTFDITYHINFEHPKLKNQFIHFTNITYQTFKKEIADARTFGFYEEVKDLLSRGLAKGGNLKNAVVLTKDGYLNKKLRFKNECIRHKVLDLIGCISILNAPIKGHFIAYRSGHNLDYELIKKIDKMSSS